MNKNPFQPVLLSLTVIGIIVLISLSPRYGYAQGVAINNDNSNPHASSMLDVKSTSAGVLIPRMTLAQRNAIASPATGLMIYQTNSTPGFYFNAGTTGSPNWRMIGYNSGTFSQWTTSGSHIYYNTGNVGIGNSTPTALLHVNGDIIVNGMNIGRGGGNFASSTAIGGTSLQSNTTGYSNTAVGWGTLAANSSGRQNTATGYMSLHVNSSGEFNVAAGSFSLRENTTGSQNTAMGYESLRSNTTGNQNAAIGIFGLFNNLTGWSNVSVGPYALYSNTDRSNLVAVGDSALYNNGTGATDEFQGTGNTALGSKAMFANETGQDNTASGIQSLYSNTTGTFNTANGAFCMNFNTIGSGNTASGSQTLYFNNTGSNNTAYGFQAMAYNKAGNDATAIGFQAMLYAYNTASTFPSENVAVGAYALRGSGTPGANSGTLNTAIGSYALYQNTSGTRNTAGGKSSLSANSSGNHNTAYGSFSLYVNETGHSNTAVGTDSQWQCENGWQNTSLGANSLTNNVSGSYNTAIGYNTGSNSSNRYNTTCLGIDATATADNQVRIGNVFVASIGGYQNWTNISDGRFKVNVQDDVPGLDFIVLLRPVTYRLDREMINEATGVNEHRNKISDKESETEFLTSATFSDVTTGFIAQEVEAAARQIGFSFSGVDAPKNKDDVYGLRYAEFVVPLVKAVQEQQAQIEALKSENEVLKSRLDALEK